MKRYKAVALRRCQFQGLLYREGASYTGGAEPPRENFKVLGVEDISQDVLREEEKAKAEKAVKELTPSNPTPRDRKAEAKKKDLNPQEVDKSS